MVPPSRNPPRDEPSEDEEEPENDEEDLESLTSQQEWELFQGIPQPDEPFLEKYFAGRSSLIEQEKKQRHDRIFKQTMSPLAKQASKIMASIRRRELKDKWSSEYEGRLAADGDNSGTLYPGMMFTLARERMQSTELWKIIERMPKGALLHAHMDAMFDIDALIEAVLVEKGVCMCAEQGLSDKVKRTFGDFHFQYFSEQDINKAGTRPAAEANIWSDRYVGGTPVKVSQARMTFPDHDTTFVKWLMGRCTIGAEESLWHHHGLDAIWKKFQSTFPIVDSMVVYEPIFRKAFSRLLGQLADDGIMYVDLRMVFLFQHRMEGKTTTETGYTKWFGMFEEEIKKFQATEAGKNFRGARMIWTCLRIFDNRKIAETMMDCIAMKKKFPHLICGFDCVGQEDSGRTLKDLTPVLFWFKKKCHEAGVDIPFFFHAGECLGDGDSTDNNLYDAILLGSRRIGHGYSLYKHPLLIDMVKEKKILIESCPISNEILRLSSSILSHSLPALLSRGVPVSLNNDDPAILGHGKNGLSHDFWQTFMAWENLGLEGLATMAENSIRYCAIEDKRQADWLKGIQEGYMGKTKKAQLLKEWRTAFEKWCQWIIMEYPLEVEEDDDEEEDEEDDEDDE